MAKQIRIHRWIIVLALTVFVSIYYKSILGNILSEIKKLPVSMTVISLLFTYIYYLIEGKLIQFVASRHVKGFTWNQGTTIAYISSFYRFLTMGAAAGPAEVYYLHREDIPISTATGMCLAKYIIHKITIVIYGIVCYLALPDKMKDALNPYRYYIITGILIMSFYSVILIAICTSHNFSKFIIWLLKKIPIKKTKFQKKISDLIENIIMLQDESSDLLMDKKKILWIFILNIGKQTSYYLIPAVLLFQRCDITGIYVIALMAMSNMLAGVLPAPSGIGSLEYVFLQLFMTLTIAKIAGSVILIYRFVTWVVPFGIGGVALALQKRRSVKD